MPRKLTKKEKEMLEQLKTEYFDENDKLYYMNLIDENDSALYRIAFIPNKTKAFKLYGHIDKACEDGADDSFNVDFVNWKNHPDKEEVFAVNMENNDELHEVFKYLAIN
jgi:hypothetical protein